MTIRILVGDCREILPQFPDDYFHCVVTSPPFWGLRDYGIAPSLWGGDPECKHEWGELLPDSHRVRGGGNLRADRKGAGRDSARGKTAGQFCQHCSAWRGCLGLEPMIELYVAHLVEVFREVHQVLRDDGTVWINLGSSYASSRPAQNADACGNDGTRRPNWSKSGHAYLHCDDVRQGDSQSHRARSSRNAQERRKGELPLSPTGHDNGPGGCEPTSPDASSLGAQGSTIPSLPRYAQDASDPEARASVCPRGLQTSSGDVPPCAGTSACTSCIAGISLTSNRHMLDKVFSDSACGDPFCKGTCGICWAYYTIPTLKVKQKDLISIPWLVAFALQADGWWIRSDIIWSKPNCMPESVRDRPTKAHEYVFLLSKNERYFYDADAIREPQTGNAHSRGSGMNPKGALAERGRNRANDSFHASTAKYVDVPGGRNKRTVWTIPTYPLKETHFAAFPPALVEPCIKAGTSERGACPECGAGWVRVVEASGGTIGQGWHDHKHDDTQGIRQKRGDIPTGTFARKGWKTYKRETIGFRPTCTCYDHRYRSEYPRARSARKRWQQDMADRWLPRVKKRPGKDDWSTIPCRVLDPFAGAGTTGVVADRLGRDAVLIDIKAEYCEMARDRIVKDVGPMFAQVTVEGA